MPKVTVLMPVYNGEKYLRESIESILCQTFRDFEFLIIDDGSTDGSAKIVRSYDDERIRFEQNERNLGIVATLNRGLDLAKGEYVARMDADDISMPERLEKQVAFMDSHPKVGVCGSWMTNIGTSRSLRTVPRDHEYIRARFVFGNPVHHPTVILRSSSLNRNGLRYDPSFLYTEDYELWTRCIDHFQISNLPEAHLFYRVHAGQISQKKTQQQRNTTRILQKRLISKMGLDPSDMEMEVHELALSGKVGLPKDFIEKMEMWYMKMLRANKETNAYCPQVLAAELGLRFFSICTASTSLGFWPWLRYYRSDLTKNSNVSFLLQAKFFLKSLVAYDSRMPGKIHL